jgi:tagaturonate epimerase
MKLAKFSMGIGDRFGHQGIAQLRAIQRALDLGVEISPVWNKSNREHTYTGTQPADTKAASAKAVKDFGWNHPWFVDADHINLSNVDKFIDHADFFTLDVADYIGKPATAERLAEAQKSCAALIGSLQIPGLAKPLEISQETLTSILNKFLFATDEAAKIYEHIAAAKGKGNFIPEVSMDEVDEAQSPMELLVILKLLADKNVPAETIAPKFTGRFNKGVEYKGDLVKFEDEFEADLLVIDYAVKNFGLPESLKLSIHSGSDKFGIYPIMKRLIAKHNKGLHLKTAGTTWLEEVIGLAVADGEALAVAKHIYAEALKHKEKLCAPYATVIEIDDSKLPSAEEVNGWSAQKFAFTLRHIQSNKDYNPSFRQLIHVGYKIAADLGDKYLSLLDKHKDVVGQCVMDNIYDRHITRIFL